MHLLYNSIVLHVLVFITENIFINLLRKLKAEKVRRMAEENKV